MKIKNKYIFNFILYYCKTPLFIGSIIMMLIFALVFGSSFGEEGFFANFLLLISSNYFFGICLLIPFLLNTINIQNEYEKNVEFIIRNKSKKNYFKNMIITSILLNIILFVCAIFCLAFGTIVTGGFSIDSISYIDMFGVNVIIYTVYHLIKIFIFLQLISVINLFLLKLFDKQIVVIINFFVTLLSLTQFLNFNSQIETLKDIPFNYTYYFSSMRFSSFTLNVMCTTINILIYICIAYFLYKIVIKKVKQIGE